MPTDLDLANAALSLLGEAPLNSLTDDRKAATVLTPRIGPVRDALLRSHPWNFSSSRATLALSATSPPFGFANAFALPTDYLRVREVNGGLDPFEIERQGPILVLLTDASSVNLKYTARVTNPSEWDPMFYETMAAALALDVSIALLGSDTDAYARTKDIFIGRLEQARSADGQENPPIEIHDDDFLGAWFGTGFFRPIGEPT